MEWQRFEVESMFNEIKELLQYLDTNNLTNKNYLLFLANLPNGENLKFKITKESIPHLLGINTNYLISTRIFNNRSAYSLLEEMLDNEFKIYDNSVKKVLDYNKLFSPHIKKKIKCFKDNLDMNVHSIDVIVKYTPERTYTERALSEKFDYAIVKRYQNGNIGLLYLAQNSDGIYVPMSSQILETEKEKEEILEKVFKNQEATYINGIHVKEFETTKSHISLDGQIERIFHLREYKDKYNTSIDVSSNCLYFIKKLKANKNTFIQNDEITEIIIDSIRNGKIINIPEGSELYPIASAINDKISSDDFESTEAAITYTEQSKELERIKRELEELKAYKTMLEQQVLELTETNSDLTGRVNASEEREKQILKILKPEN